jgi:hypothetical protein
MCALQMMSHMDLEKRALTVTCLDCQSELYKACVEHTCRVPCVKPELTQSQFEYSIAQQCQAIVSYSPVHYAFEVQRDGG